MHAIMITTCRIIHRVPHLKLYRIYQDRSPIPGNVLSGFLIQLISAIMGIVLIFSYFENRICRNLTALEFSGMGDWYDPLSGIRIQEFNHRDDSIYSSILLSYKYIFGAIIGIACLILLWILIKYKYDKFVLNRFNT